MGERARSRTLAQSLDVVASSQQGPTIAGRLAAEAWLRGLSVTPLALMPWHVEISLDVRDQPATREFDERRDTRFHIEIYSAEWGFFFCHQNRASWVRVTDIPFMHGRDDFRLLPRTPALKDLGPFLRALEKEHGLVFRREHAHVRTNLANAEAAVRRWILAL